MNELANYNFKSSTGIVLGTIPDNQKEKIKFYNEVLNCETKVDTILGVPKKIKYIHVASQKIKRDNHIGYEITPRMVFYFMDETSVISFSIGIFNSLEKMVEIFGNPPYDFSIKFIQINKGRERVYTIDIVEDN